MKKAPDRKNKILFLKYFLKKTSWIIAVILTLIIFYFSTRAWQNPIMKEIKRNAFFGVDYLHIVEFFIAGLFIIFAFFFYPPTKKSYIIYSIASVIFIAIADEIFIQSLIPTRTPDINDLIKDLIGFVLALFCFLVVKEAYYNKFVQLE
ncbi:hypothetical protein GF361_01640 [Candidatus Woesearchaeota archaeon]|nr:hypothetical protein [Candidatus Woesearchaeota archaeon]